MSPAARIRGPAQPPPRHATLNEALGRAAQDASGLTFVAADESEEALSWAALRLRALRVSGALVSLGVERGERIALVLPTGPEFMDAFFGTLLAGAVPVPLYPPVRLGRLDEYHASTARMLDAAGAVLVLTDARVRRLLGPSVERARPRLGCRRVSELREATLGPLEREVSEDALALVQFSSGSTVDPRPVALTHRNVLAQCDALRVLMPEETDGVRQLGVSWLPLYHDMGLIGFLLSAVTYPGPLVLIPPEHFLARPALWLRAVSRHRGTVSAAPNFAYAVCARRVKDADLVDVDLSPWKLALNGAEPVAATVVRRFIERFRPYGFSARALLPVYGLAEASLAVTFCPPRDTLRTESVEPALLRTGATVTPGPRTLVTMGRPIPGVELEIRDRAGNVVPERVVGCVVVKGPSVMAGYLGQEAATREALVDGWLDTGDLGYLTDGELVICGRSKDVVIVRGANHAPQEFEDALEGIPGVRPGCAVALGCTREGDEGETLLLLVERTAHPPPDLAARIRSEVLARTGILPDEVEVLAPGTLPRTSSGKLRRGEALRRWTSGTLTPPKRVTVLWMARELLRSAAAFSRADGER